MTQPLSVVDRYGDPTSQHTARAEADVEGRDGFLGKTSPVQMRMALVKIGQAFKARPEVAVIEVTPANLNTLANEVLHLIQGATQSNAG